MGKGKIIGASADGRKSGEPLSINISPAPGRDRNSPTAVINSASKLNVGSWFIKNSSRTFTTHKGSACVCCNDKKDLIYLNKIVWLYNKNKYTR